MIKMVIVLLQPRIWCLSPFFFLMMRIFQHETWCLSMKLLLIGILKISLISVTCCPLHQKFKQLLHHSSDTCTAHSSVTCCTLIRHLLRHSYSQCVFAHSSVRKLNVDTLRQSDLLPTHQTDRCFRALKNKNNMQCTKQFIVTSDQNMVTLGYLGDQITLIYFHGRQ